MGDGRRWVSEAISALRRDQARTADTHLIKVDLPEFPGVDFYLKDESIHPSGSLKHRLARSLFFHAICNGLVREGTTIVEASSGSTAISEAFFARLLGLPFVAVVPEGTAPAKLAAIEQAGGRLHRVPAGGDVSAVARDLARELSGCFMDQFTNAERATDWRGNNNIAESLFQQMAQEPHPVPAWVVVGAGTGGTSATIGRFIRFQPSLASTRLCVVDPEGSAFWAGFKSGDWTATGHCSAVVEGIGRPRVEPSFVPAVVDKMIEVPDAASIAGMRWLEHRLGRRFGPSTGANVIGVLKIAAEMAASGGNCAIASLACDPGERYHDTVYDNSWLRSRGVDPAPWIAGLADDPRRILGRLQQASR
jgi:cysteine synthase A